MLWLTKSTGKIIFKILICSGIIVKINVILEILTLSTKGQRNLFGLMVGLHLSGLEIVLRQQVS